MNKKIYVKLAVFLFLIAGFFLLFRKFNINFSGMNEENFRNWVSSLGVWGPLFYILIYIFRPLILFPAGVLSATAGIIWGPVIGFLYLQVAANLSSAIEFLAARYFASDFVKKIIGKKLIKLDDKITKHGFLTVLLIRLIPNVAWDIQNLSLGLTKVKFRDYFFATLVGIMPGSFAFVFFGASLIKVLFNHRNMWILGVAILIFVGIFFLTKYLKKKHKDKISLNGGRE